MQCIAASRLGMLLALASCICLETTLGYAQAADDGRPTQARVHPPTDRTLSRGMRQAEESIQRGEFAQPLVFLDDLLGQQEDFFTETGAEGGYAGLKETARRLIRDLPPEGRRTYESAYGPVAERLVRDAVAAGDAAGLERVVQRYFYTPAGYQAALLLAANESDAGRHLAAALLYQQLLETPAAVRLHDPELSVRAAASWLAADDADQARRVIEALTARGSATVEIAGRDYAMTDKGGPLDWLRATVGEPAGVSAAPERQWLNYRGNAARNGETAGGLPHMRVRWKVGLLRPFPKLEELFEEYNGELTHSGDATPVAGAPLAAGDYIIVRSPLGLSGVDFRTGKLVWQSERQRDPQIEQLVKSGGGPEEEMANAEPARAFARRIWEDYLYGVISSDGARIYAIRDLPMPAPQDYDQGMFMNVGGPESPAPSNRLTAYDLAREGTMVWEIDGAAIAGDLNGAFFLGAPLPVGSSLFVLVEIRDDIYLAALDRTTGALQWRQQLANLETGVLLDLRRRLQAAMPSYDAGMLVCPTGAGVVVGVDLSKRSLAWAYRYETIPPFDGVYRGGVQEAAANATSRWTDGATLIADGRVLLTPPESTDLHCLDLRTGRRLWKRPRGDMKRLACVYDGLALFMGKSQLTALKIEDGQPAWRSDDGTSPRADLALPPGASPSGAGFVSDGKYYFPLTTAEVVAVDLSAGRIVARVQARDGAPLGNLICHRGTVISQNGLSLDCFDQVDVLLKRSQAKLAAEPDNVEALRSLGEIAYNEGRLSEAIDLVERAFRFAPEDLDTRELLAECLADALDEDFAAYRTKLPLLKELEVDGSIDRLHVLRIEAEGLLETGDPLGSAAACLAMTRAIGEADEMLSLRRDHETLASRWVQSQLAAIWDASNPEQRTQFVETVRTEAKSLGEHPTGEQLERFLNFYGSLPEFEAWKLTRARQLEDDKRVIESQQLLIELTHSANESLRREAIARVASQLHAAGLHPLAREYDDELAGPLGDEPCLDGAKGSDLVKGWADETAVDIAWPTGRVDVRTVSSGGATAGARARTPVWSVRLEHADSILGRGVGFLAPLRDAELSWQDGYGRPFFSASLGQESQALYRQSGSVYGSSRGNLLIVSLGRELAAFNTLARADSQTPALLWRTSLGSNFDYQNVYMDDFSRSTERRPGSYRAPRMMVDDKWAGVIGPITSRGCIFQDQRRLVCVDSVTGEVQWSRSDAPQGCDLFGDERYVFATPIGSNTAQVYSVIDGRALGTVRVPEWEQQLATRGRRVIRWSANEQGEFELAEVDPLTKDVSWRHEFAVGSRVDIDLDRYIAVVEPTGRGVIIDGQTGGIIREQSLTPQATLDEIHLSAGTDSFVLVVEHATARNTDREVRSLVNGDSPVVDGEVMVFDRRSDAPRWSRPASVLRQALVLNQPADLPFIMFAGTLVSRTRGEGHDATTMLLIDKATGRTLYNTDELPQAGAGFCMARVSDPVKHEVTIDMAGRTLQVQYTEGRRAPEPPAMAEVESSAGRTSEGILGILRVLGE